MVHIPNHPLMLFDGSYYLYRSYHVFSHLSGSTGEPTGAMYGVLNVLRSFILTYKATHAAVVFDEKEKTFRNKLFKYYKIHRQPMPNDLYLQINPLYAMIKAIGLLQISVSGFEADDVIGTLASKAEKMGHSVLIVTGDKDMAQLVTPRVILMNTITKTFVGVEEVLRKYGVLPDLIADLFALMGDSSDNIPGVPGIGRKSAQALLREIGGLNAIYAQINKIPTLTFRGAKNLAIKLKKNKELAYLSYSLAKIKTDIALNLTYEQMAIKKPAIKESLALFKKYGFDRWITDIKCGRSLLI